jgi:hypothetical protein
MLKRRVRVTASARRTAPPGDRRRQVDAEMAAPTETRTPMGTGAYVAPARVRMEAGRQRRRRTWHRARTGTGKEWQGRSGRPAIPSCLIARQRSHPSRLPCRLAALGLDRAWPRCRKTSAQNREWQALAGRLRLPGRLPPANRKPLDTDRPSHGSRARKQAEQFARVKAKSSARSKVMP